LFAQDDSIKIFDVIEEGRRIKQIKFGKFRKFHKNILAKDFSRLGRMLYNHLPLEIRELDKYNAFISKLKTYLLDKKEILLRGNQLLGNKLTSSSDAYNLKLKYPLIFKVL
jgi:hypothetical protein